MPRVDHPGGSSRDDDDRDEQQTETEEEDDINGTTTRSTRRPQRRAPRETDDAPDVKPEDREEEVDEEPDETPGEPQVEHPEPEGGIPRNRERDVAERDQPDITDVDEDERRAFAGANGDVEVGEEPDVDEDPGFVDRTRDVLGTGAAVAAAPIVAGIGGVRDARDREVPTDARADDVGAADFVGDPTGALAAVQRGDEILPAEMGITPGEAEQQVRETAGRPVDAALDVGSELVSGPGVTRVGVGGAVGQVPEDTPVTAPGPLGGTGVAGAARQAPAVLRETGAGLASGPARTGPGGAGDVAESVARYGEFAPDAVERIAAGAVATSPFIGQEVDVPDRPVDEPGEIKQPESPGVTQPEMPAEEPRVVELPVSDPTGFDADRTEISVPEGVGFGEDEITVHDDGTVEIPAEATAVAAEQRYEEDEEEEEEEKEEKEEEDEEEVADDVIIIEQDGERFEIEIRDEEAVAEPEEEEVADVEATEETTADDERDLGELMEDLLFQDFALTGDEAVDEAMEDGELVTDEEFLDTDIEEDEFADDEFLDPDEVGMGGEFPGTTADDDIWQEATDPTGMTRLEPDELAGMGMIDDQTTGVGAFDDDATDAGFDDDITDAYDGPGEFVSGDVDIGPGQREDITPDQTTPPEFDTPAPPNLISDPGDPTLDEPGHPTEHPPGRPPGRPHGRPPTFGGPAPPRMPDIGLGAVDADVGVDSRRPGVEGGERPIEPGWVAETFEGFALGPFRDAEAAVGDDDLEDEIVTLGEFQTVGLLEAEDEEAEDVQSVFDVFGVGGGRP